MFMVSYLISGLAFNIEQSQERIILLFEMQRFMSAYIFKIHKHTIKSLRKYTLINAVIWMMIFNTSCSLAPLSPLRIISRMLSFYSHIRAWKNFLQLCKGNSKVGLEGNSQQWEWRKQCVWWGGRVFIPWGHPKLRETLDVTVKLIQGRDTKA